MMSSGRENRLGGIISRLMDAGTLFGLSLLKRSGAGSGDYLPRSIR